MTLYRKKCVNTEDKQTFVEIFIQFLHFCMATKSLFGNGRNQRNEHQFVKFLFVQAIPLTEYLFEKDKKKSIFYCNETKLLA